MDEQTFIDVGGIKFRIKTPILQRHPATLLGSLSNSSENYNKADNCFYFDRNPELFNTILDYYRNGEIHLPTSFCAALWKSKFQFWKIPFEEISECCYNKVSKYDEDEALSAYLKNVFVGYKMQPNKNKSYLEKFRHQVWLFLDEPGSSKYARAYSFIYLSIILLSAVLPCLSTHPNVREERMNMTDLTWWLSFADINTWMNFNNPKEAMFATTEIPRWLYHLDIFISVLFTLEIFARIITCPSKRKFFLELLNMLDIVLLLGMWSHLYISSKHEDSFLENKHLTFFFCFTEALSVFRLLRFFRVAKQYDSLQILFIALKASLKELCLLIVTFLVIAWVFSNLIFYAEIREETTFPNMLVGFWWAVVTMTTVGYGDMFPTGPLGRVVGALCATCGLLVLAMPIAIIAGNFNDLYKKNREREAFNKLHQSNKRSNCSSVRSKIEPYSITCKHIHQIKSNEDHK